ncbi:MAG TPA: hypothetical protein VHK90_16220 [Thermoanaerobaculia bacterium]|nr:hypothetical protein [Thermoanaerobaculia bacterium]
MNGSSPTPSSNGSRTRWSSVLLVLALLAPGVVAQETLTAVSTRDRKVVKRFALPGDPRGVAAGPDGTIYAGLAGPQAVVAIDPKTGAVKKRLVLDSAEIASTKELVTLRVSADGKRLFIANGSDESASILSLPDLAVLREITMEGETIRDVVPDPKGRYVYLLGRRVHVFDGEGDTELRTLDVEDPMAIAVSANGSLLAVIATEDFGSTKATVAVLFDTTNFAELSRDPLQTEKTIEAAMFAARDRSLVAFSRDALFEKPVHARPTRVTGTNGGTMRADIGELVNSDHVCLPNGSGPQIATLATTDTLLVYAERRCSASGSFSGSSRGITPASLYGVNAYALAYDKTTNTLVATDPAGFLTIYNMPRPAKVR